MRAKSAVKKVRTSPRKEASQERSKATVNVIMRATARVLVREGYDRASTNKIAAQAGVSIGSLYQYFPSKEALVTALAVEHAQEMEQLLQAELLPRMGEPLEEVLMHTVRLMVEVHALHPALHKVLAEEVPNFRRVGRLKGIEERMLALARGVLEARKRELAVEDLDLAAFIVVTIIESLTHGAVLYRQDLLGERFVREVAKVLAGYLLGSRAASVQKPQRPATVGKARNSKV